MAGTRPVVLDEYQVPKFQKSLAVAIDSALVSGYILFVAVLKAAV
jgi:hypothetical protein